MRSKIILTLASFYIAMCFCAGCETIKAKMPFKKDEKIPKEVATTPLEQKKTELLKQIDKKYQSPEAHYELGKIYQAQGRWAEAEQQFTVTLGFDPVHRSAQAAKVKVLLDSGDKATADFSTDFYLNQASSSAYGSLKLGMAFQEEKLDELAVRAYQQALRLAPNSARVNKQIGYYYLAKGQNDTAKIYLQRSFQLNPKQPEVAGELGRLGVIIQPVMPKQQNLNKLEKEK